MNSLIERNAGKHKTELLFGLCSTESARLIPHRTVVYKRLASAFKYLCAHILNLSFIASVRQSCPACNDVSGSVHKCVDKIKDKNLKSDKFYFLLQTLDRTLLKTLFTSVCRDYSGEATHICSCILFYKCKTIWRPLIRKQFLDDFVPRGLDDKLMNIILCQLAK